ncbi:uncharacterized protein LOC133724910 [Rosa rugosa]|uniref:uncharacterized protein LOC133724910 n=1 Tax=Rosa rugosa TaxID=74645 RepID=UPI002B40F4F6|nr:uncharacterized protein LOC133724910 [Rosa rugosa]
MNCIAWNCQGLGKPLTVQSLREIAHSHTPDFIFLSETHKCYSYVDSIRTQLGYTHSYYVDPVNTAGGLSLWWKEDFLVKVNDYSKYFIDTEITLPDSGSLIRVTWMYGPPYHGEKENFWNRWYNKRRPDGNPWMVIGDLNEMLFLHEREGITPGNLNRRRYLEQFVASNCLMDVGFKGQKYTWARKEDGITVLQERIDRCLVCDEWLLSWPNSGVTHLTRIGSDHNPILFTSNPILSKRRGQFKFEAQWAEEEETYSVIHDSWNCSTNLPNLSQWENNLNNCKVNL